MKRRDNNCLTNFTTVTINDDVLNPKNTDDLLKIYNIKCDPYFLKQCDFIGYKTQNKSVMGFDTPSGLRCCRTDKHCDLDIR